MSRYDEYPPKFPFHPVPYDEALVITKNWMIENLMSEEDRERGLTVSIADYFDGDENKREERPLCGVRVAEVDFHIPGVGGGSYMQVDQPWGIAVCGQVERCILALVEGWNKDAHIPDEGEPWYDTDDEFWRLENLFQAAKES